MLSHVTRYWPFLIAIGGALVVTGLALTVGLENSERLLRRMGGAVIGTVKEHPTAVVAVSVASVAFVWGMIAVLGMQQRKS